MGKQGGAVSKDFLGILSHGKLPSQGPQGTQSAPGTGMKCRDERGASRDNLGLGMTLRNCSRGDTPERLWKIFLCFSFLLFSRFPVSPEQMPGKLPVLMLVPRHFLGNLHPPPSWSKFREQVPREHREFGMGAPNIWDASTGDLGCEHWGFVI